MTTNTPCVSIGLPVYNGERYLRQTLDSLLGQTFTDFELVISDNASTDSTEKVCLAYAEQDPRIRYVRAEKNRGAVWNYNRAFELARGRYFQWASHDDLWAPTFLRTCVDALDADRDRVLALPRVAIIDSAGHRIVADQSRRGSDYEIMTDDLLPGRRDNLESDRPHRRYFGVLVQTIRCQEIYGLIRCDALRRSGLMRAYTNSEKVLLAELALMGKIHEPTEVLYYSRWHDERYSNSHDAEFKSEHFVTDKPKTKKRRRFVWPHQPRCMAGYLAVVFTARIGLLDRLRCLGSFTAFLLQAKRWKSVIARMLKGTTMTVDIPENARRGERVVATSDTTT
jgi:glycosyltransferase involved in cell wall biosynthesis